MQAIAAALPMLQVVGAKLGSAVGGGTFGKVVQGVTTGGSGPIMDALGLTPGASNKLQIPPIPKFGGGAAPGLAPAPAVPDVPTGGGLTPGATNSFTAPSASATTPAGGGDFSAAIAQALSQILGQGGGGGQQQDAFSGQFGGM
jgi:hypothetical protein